MIVSGQSYSKKLDAASKKIPGLMDFFLRRFYSVQKFCIALHKQR
jgi:hypothetical protein